MTPEQAKIIGCIERVLHYKFTGSTEEEAKKFIQENIEEYIDVCMQ